LGGAVAIFPGIRKRGLGESRAGRRETAVSGLRVRPALVIPGRIVFTLTKKSIEAVKLSGSQKFVN